MKNLIRKMIRERILSQEGTKAPNFTGSWERDGALVFACANEETRDWLNQITVSLKIGENTLRVMPIDELPERHRVIIHVEEPDVTTGEVLSLLGRQNKGLTTSNWVVTRGSESRDAHFACFVGDRSLEALKKLNFRPFCGLGRATVRVLGKDRKGGKKVTETEKTV
jgi:hypothetical protein